MRPRPMAQEGAEDGARPNLVAPVAEELRDSTDNAQRADAASKLRELATDPGYVRAAGSNRAHPSQKRDPDSGRASRHPWRPVQTPS